VWSHEIKTWCDYYGKWQLGAMWLFWLFGVTVMVSRFGSHGNLKPDVIVVVLLSRQPGVIIMANWCYALVLVAWCDCHGI
jgi:hypothetical protein